MKSILKISLLAVIMLAPTLVPEAQATGMGMGAPCGGPFPPCPVPLDSGVILLILAGAAFGVWKIFQSFKKNPA